MKIICDLCDKEVPEATKQGGLWVCKKCNNKYPQDKVE